MQRQLAIRSGGEIDARQFLTQFDVIVDFGIGDQHGPARFVQRLIAGREIDDGQPGMNQADAAVDITAAAIGSAMGQRPRQRVQCVRVRRATVCSHDACYATHDD